MTMLATYDIAVNTESVTILLLKPAIIRMMTAHPVDKIYLISLFEKISLQDISVKY